MICIYCRSRAQKQLITICRRKGGEALEHACASPCRRRTGGITPRELGGWGARPTEEAPGSDCVRKGLAPVPPGYRMSCYSLSGMSLILSGGSVPAALATAVRKACHP